MSWYRTLKHSRGENDQDKKTQTVVGVGVVVGVVVGVGVDVEVGVGVVVVVGVGVGVGVVVGVGVKKGKPVIYAARPCRSTRTARSQKGRCAVNSKLPMTDYNCELMFARMIRDCLAAFIAARGEERYREATDRYFVRDAYRDVLEGIRANPTAKQCPGFAEWVADHQARCEYIIDREMQRNFQ